MNSMTVVARLVSAAALSVMLVTVAGCAPSPGVGSVHPGIPDGVTLDPLNGSPTAAWIERGESFAIVTMGSSSCPVVASSIDAAEDDRVSVTFGPSPNDPCSADMAPTTHEFDLPAGVTSDRITVEIRFEEWPEVYTVTLD